MPIARILYSLIMPLVGVLFTLYGFQVLGNKEHPRYEEWYGKWGRHLKWLGPLLIVIGLILFAVKMSGG